MKPPFTNLAIQGGGVRGIAYVGAIKELQTQNLLTNIKRVAGTSAGALLALMFALGYSADQMHEIMLKMDFKKFSWGKSFLRIFTKYGLHSGDYILDFVKDLLAKSDKNLTVDATFEDLKQAGCPELHVFTTDLTMHCYAEFSINTHPSVSVAEAVRASMSIPFYFKAWRFSNKNPNDHIYVDGGLIYNYPITFFDRKEIIELDLKNSNLVGASALETYSVNPTTLGLRLYNSELHDCDKLSFYTLLHYSRHLFETLINEQSIVKDLESSEVSRSINIDCFDITATDFNLTKEKQDTLVESGQDCTRKWMVKHGIKN